MLHVIPARRYVSAIQQGSARRAHEHEAAGAALRFEHGTDQHLVAFRRSLQETQN
jgi:hypothetical protein